MKASKILPRIDLQEKAFRKYERHISNACFKSITIDPRTCFVTEQGSGRSMSAYSYCTRFRDAVRGYKIFKYPSMLIPKGYNLDNIEAKMLENGMVLLKNDTADYIQTGAGTATKRPGYYDACDKDSILKLIDKIKQENVGAEYPGLVCYRVCFESAEELAWLRQIVQEHSNDVSGDLSEKEENVFLIN